MDTPANTRVTIAKESLLSKPLNKYGFSGFSDEAAAKKLILGLIFNGESSLGRLEDFFDNAITGRTKVVQFVGQKLNELRFDADLKLLPPSGASIDVLVVRPVQPRQCVSTSVKSNVPLSTNVSSDPAAKPSKGSKTKKPKKSPSARACVPEAVNTATKPSPVVVASTPSVPLVVGTKTSWFSRFLQSMSCIH
jgi:hypothetical protein